LFDSIFTNLVYVPFGIATVMAYRKSPPLLKRLAVAAGVYVLAIVVGASWRESQRLILPILPLLVPTLLTNPHLSQRENIGSL
jgi:hypothetical protein